MSSTEPFHRIRMRSLKCKVRQQHRLLHHRGSTAGQKNLPLILISISNMPSSHAAHSVLPSGLIAKPAVRTPSSRPLYAPLSAAERRSNISLPCCIDVGKRLVSAVLATPPVLLET